MRITKMKKTLSALLMIALCLGVLSACGNSEALSGKYVCTSFVMGEEELTPEQLIESGLDPEAIYFEFIDDTSFTMVMMEEEEEGTYELNGNVLNLTIDGVTETVRCEDDIIILIDPDMGYEITFKKE